MSKSRGLCDVKIQSNTNVSDLKLCECPNYYQFVVLIVKNKLAKSAVNRFVEPKNKVCHVCQVSTV
jgi:hypothetical protein